MWIRIRFPMRVWESIALIEPASYGARIPGDFFGEGLNVEIVGEKIDLRHLHCPR